MTQPIEELSAHHGKEAHWIFFIFFLQIICLFIFFKKTNIRERFVASSKSGKISWLIQVVDLEDKVGLVALVTQ
jgi:hypothetical protein